MAEPNRDHDIFHLTRPRLSIWEKADLRREDRQRMRSNIAAAVAIVALLGLGFWLIDRIEAYSRNVTCLQYKSRVCR